MLENVRKNLEGRRGEDYTFQISGQAKNMSFEVKFVFRLIIEKLS